MRMWRAIQRLPLVVPLVAGLVVAATVDAVLPERARVDTVMIKQVDESTPPSLAQRDAEQAIEDAIDVVEPVVDAAVARVVASPLAAQVAAEITQQLDKVAAGSGPSTRERCSNSVARCTLWVPNTTSTYGARSRMPSWSFWARQPLTTISMPGRRSFTDLSWPRVP